MLRRDPGHRLHGDVERWIRPSRTMVRPDCFENFLTMFQRRRLDAWRIGYGGRSTRGRTRCGPRHGKSARRLKGSRDGPVPRRRFCLGCGGSGRDPVPAQRFAGGRGHSGRLDRSRFRRRNDGGRLRRSADGSYRLGYVAGRGKQLKAKINVAVPGPVHHTAFAQLLRIEFEPLLLLLPVSNPQHGIAAMTAVIDGPRKAAGCFRHWLHSGQATVRGWRDIASGTRR